MRATVTLSERPRAFVVFEAFAARMFEANRGTAILDIEDEVHALREHHDFAAAAQLPPCVGYAADIFDDFSNVSVDLTP
jgi:hypothetical protein